MNLKSDETQLFSGCNSFNYPECLPQLGIVLRRRLRPKGDLKQKWSETFQIYLGQLEVDRTAYLLSVSGRKTTGSATSQKEMSYCSSVRLFLLDISEPWSNLPEVSWTIVLTLPNSTWTFLFKQFLTGFAGLSEICDVPNHGAENML